MNNNSLDLLKRNLWYKIEGKTDKGYDTFIPSEDILDNLGYEVCNSILTSMKGITEKYMRLDKARLVFRIIASQNLTILSGKYHGMHTKFKLQCNKCNNIREIEALSIFSRYIKHKSQNYIVCPNCRGFKRYYTGTFSDYIKLFREYFKENNIELIKFENNGYKPTKFFLKCERGHEFTRDFNTIVAKYKIPDSILCPECKDLSKKSQFQIRLDTIKRDEDFELTSCNICQVLFYKPLKEELLQIWGERYNHKQIEYLVKVYNSFMKTMNTRKYTIYKRGVLGFMKYITLEDITLVKSGISGPSVRMYGMKIYNMKSIDIKEKVLNKLKKLEGENGNASTID